MSALTRIAVASLLLGLQLAVTVADDRPKLDLAPTCAAAAKFAISAGRDKEACLDDEHTAESDAVQNQTVKKAQPPRTSPVPAIPLRCID